ncbi:hypothetical protein [Pedobacter immunditicola]|uniref:hypothetical protein n=1 Tax=Pedobacter immunditicola TaxID=3133440 RepID=UPI0030A3AF39
MKKIILSLTLFMAATCTYAQKDSLANAIEMRSAALGHNGNNEIKVNLLYLVLGLPEISYERLISDNMGIGLSATVAVDDQGLRHAFLASYRLYFGNKKANGFFIEGNMGVVSEEEHNYFYTPDYNGNYQVTESNHTYFGLGAAAGAKFLTRNGFLGEAYLGAGRLLGESQSEYYPRIGITIGKRF